ncbi:MAG: Spy/CpxP family protein refolding chaperone [Calditrichaeota bacterium]|nr:Spy/CpxP family protein refolding chaperone [Calditrichota bacterium]
MRRNVAVAVLVSLLLVTSGVVLAQPGMPKGPEMGRVWAQLNLTDEQRKQIQELRLKLAKETLPLRNELGVKRLELKELMMADKPNLKAIEGKIDEIKKLEASLQKKRVENRLAVRSILTPEQQEKLAKLRRMGRMMHHGKKGMRRPGCMHGRGMMPHHPMPGPGPMPPEKP